MSVATSTGEQRTASATHELMTLFPTLIATLKATKGITLTLYQTFSALINQLEAFSNTAVVMGQSFDASKNDDFFYLPPEAFDNPDFQTGLRMFLSPDGKSARFFITHQGSASGSITWPVAACRCGTYASQAPKPATDPAITAAVPAAAPLATMTS